MSDSDLKGDPELMEFLQSAPPRLVPERFSKMMSDRKEVWGKILFGAMFLILGSVFTLIFVPKNYIHQLSILRGPSTEVVGTVLDSTETSQSENEVKVWETTFQYRAEDGKEREGTVFRTGGGWDPNDRVTVIYLNRDPEKALIKGTRLDPFGPAASFVLIFPIVGLGLLLTAFRGRKRSQKLLRDGWVAQAMVADIKKQSLQVNNQHRHIIQFVRLDDAQEMRWVTYDEAKIELCYRKRDVNEAVTLLYDPKKPKKIELPEAWGKTFNISYQHYLEKPKPRATAQPLPVVAPWIENFLESPVPRKIPWKLRRRSSIGFVKWILTFMGSIFTLFGSAGAYQTLPWHLPKQWIMQVGFDSTTVGTVTREEETGTSNNSVPLMRVDYTFQDQQGGNHIGSAYANGKGHPLDSKIEVNYDKSHPKNSLPDGFQLGKGSWSGLLLLPFLFAGLGMLIVPRVIEHRRFRILRRGRLVDANFARIEGTNASINDHPQFAIFARPLDGSPESCYKTHKKKELDVAMQAMESGAIMRILIDPKRPQACLLPETW